MPSPAQCHPSRCGGPGLYCHLRTASGKSLTDIGAIFDRLLLQPTGRHCGHCLPDECTDQFATDESTVYKKNYEDWAGKPFLITVGQRRTRRRINGRMSSEVGAGLPFRFVHRTRNGAAHIRNIRTEFFDPDNHFRRRHVRPTIPNTRHVRDIARCASCPVVPDSSGVVTSDRGILLP
jgi:hypothetical protein